jgi:hypothetical protein
MGIHHIEYDAWIFYNSLYSLWSHVLLCCTRKIKTKISVWSTYCLFPASQVTELNTDSCVGAQLKQVLIMIIWFMLLYKPLLKP